MAAPSTKTHRLLFRFWTWNPPTKRNQVEEGPCKTMVMTAHRDPGPFTQVAIHLGTHTVKNFGHRIQPDADIRRVNMVPLLELGGIESPGPGLTQGVHGVHDLPRCSIHTC